MSIRIYWHSQGALLSRLLSDKALNSIELNSAYKAELMNDDEHIIRSNGDAVPALTVPKKFIIRFCIQSGQKAI